MKSKKICKSKAKVTDINKDSNNKIKIIQTLGGINFNMLFSTKDKKQSFKKCTFTPIYITNQSFLENKLRPL